MIEVHSMTYGHTYWSETIALARTCSWKAGPLLAEIMENNRMKEWERVFAVCADGKVAGMYMPTEEKYRKKAERMLKDKSNQIFFCFQEGVLCGMISLKTDQFQSEITGIAVAKSYRKQGIGSFMIQQIINEKGISNLYAETDDGAVNFYEKCGFTTQAKIEEYNGLKIVRYHCSLSR